MSIVIFCVAATFLFGKALSQTPTEGCTHAGTTTISTSEQITAIAQCVMYSGHVEITSASSSSTATPTLSLNPLKRIDGGISILGVQNYEMVESSTLYHAEALSIARTNVKRLNFPALQSVDILWISDTPMIDSISLDAGVSVKELTVDQSFNAHALTMNVTSASLVDIISHGSARFTFLLKKATRIYVHDLDLQHPSSVAFPDLKTVDRLLCIYCSEVSLPQLVAVNEFLLVNKSQMDISLPRLAEIDGELSIHNSRISSLDLGKLSRVGSFKVADISGIKSLDTRNMGSLENISGDFHIVGDFQAIDLNGLQYVGGNTHIESSDKTMDCSNMDRLKITDKLKGNYTCNGTHLHNSSLPTPPVNSTESEFQGDSSLPTGSKTGIGVGVGVGVLGLLLTIAFYISRRKGKNASRAALEERGFEKPEIDGVEKARNTETYEMIGENCISKGQEAQELPGEHGLSEVAGDGATGVRVVGGTHELPS